MFPSSSCFDSPLGVVPRALILGIILTAAILLFAVGSVERHRRMRVSGAVLFVVAVVAIGALTRAVGAHDRTFRAAVAHELSVTYGADVVDGHLPAHFGETRDVTLTVEGTQRRCQITAESAAVIRAVCAVPLIRVHR